MSKNKNKLQSFGPAMGICFLNRCQTEGHCPCRDKCLKFGCPCDGCEKAYKNCNVGEIPIDKYL